MEKPYISLYVLGTFVMASAWCIARASSCEDQAKLERDSYKQGMLYKYVKQYKIAATAILILGCLISGLLILT